MIDTRRRVNFFIENEIIFSPKAVKSAKRHRKSNNIYNFAGYNAYCVRGCTLAHYASVRTRA